jgi:GNAT superfamily N-acetyltransferase
MEFITLHQWDEAWWHKAAPLYLQAFPTGSKSEGIIRSMFTRGIAYLHLGVKDNEPVAVAITGTAKDDDGKVLIIDYLAVRADLRSQGIGEHFLERIRKWAEEEVRVKGVVIEVESEDTPINRRRKKFWEKCGFTLTSYIHTYIWVPEPYQAMVLPLSGSELPEDGESLFRYINRFHQEAYRSR